MKIPSSGKVNSLRIGKFAKKSHNVFGRHLEKVLEVQGDGHIPYVVRNAVTYLRESGNNSSKRGKDFWIKINNCFV